MLVHTKEFRNRAMIFIMFTSMTVTGQRTHALKVTTRTKYQCLRYLYKRISPVMFVRPHIKVHVFRFHNHIFNGLLYICLVRTEGQVLVVCLVGALLRQVSCYVLRYIDIKACSSLKLHGSVSHTLRNAAACQPDTNCGALDYDSGGGL